ncbi:Hypothetical_protein [Hexamita inflata]|uniref:Hypothetical_protein n=1 Tax=Hexamita inflata TaxID=28002 RepID=A0AA86TUL6_9EUKA|nr:Hypothetical protein HINF_LOCUS17070 [Hexamita inflata]
MAVSNSIINITIDFEIVQGALICIQCDSYIKQSTLIFVASGAVLSGVMLKSQNYIVIDNTSIQFRLDCKNMSGIVNELHALKKILLNNLKLTGYAYQDSIYNGFIASNVIDNVNVQIFNTKVCTNNIGQSGQSTGALSINDSFQQTCVSICSPPLHYVYGICLPNLELGQYSAINESYWCELPFIYDGYSCHCQYGYLLNISYCVDIINTLTQLDVQLASNFSNLSDTLKYNVSQLEAHINANLAYTEQSMLNNKSFLMNQINNLNVSLTKSIDDLSNKVNTINSTLTQTTVSLQSQLDTTNYNLQQLKSKQATEIQDIKQQYSDHLVNTNAIEIKQNQSLFTKQQSIYSLNSSLNGYISGTTLNNSQQDQNINSVFQKIQQSTQTAKNVQGSLDSLNSRITGSLNNLQSQYNAKANIPDLYYQYQIDSMYSALQGNINNQQNRIQQSITYTYICSGGGCGSYRL